jgi:terminase large subunit-like protein
VPRAERAPATRSLDPRRWKGGADGFFLFLDDVQPHVPRADGSWGPLVLEGWQRDDIRAALDGGYRTAIFCHPRRHGKTLIVALIILWRFVSRESQTICLVSNSANQSVAACFRLVSGIIRRTPALLRLIGAKHIQVDKILFPGLDNLIEALPSNPAALIGRKVSVAQVSELHAARDADVFDAMASSTGDSAEGLVLVDSTVGSRSGPLYRLVGLVERGEDPATFVSERSYADLADALARSPAWINRAWLTSRSKQMLPMEFARYHLNRWSSGSNALFTEADLAASMVDLPHPVPLDVLREFTAGRTFLVGGGLDRAYGFSLHGDQTIVTAVAKVAADEGPEYIVLFQKAIMFSAASGIKKAFTECQDRYGFANVGVESYNAQDIWAWLLEKTIPAEVIHATNTAQIPAFTELHRIVAEHRLRVPTDLEPLLAEMKTFEYDVETAATPRFGAAGGHHDDRVYSLAWAVHALREHELTAYELGAVVCDADERAQQMCYLFGNGHVLPCADRCPTHREVAEMYARFRARDVAELPLIDFFRSKVKSVGFRIRRAV